MNGHILDLAIWGTLVVNAVLSQPVAGYFMYKKFFDKPLGATNLFVYGLLCTLIYIFYAYKFIEAVINDTPYLR